jgi:ATP-binding cassette subfamily B protein/subfamily B ATP-binding cassette protein MsbA
MISTETKKILGELKPHSRTLIFIALASLINSASQIGVATLIKPIIDSMDLSGQGDLITFICKALLLSLAVCISRYYKIYLMNMTSERVSIHLRHRLQQKFMKLNLTFHNTFASGSGGLISRVLNDITIIQNGLRMFADFFSEPLTFVGLLVYLFWLDWKLTASIFIILPIILYFQKTISKSIKKYSIKGQEDLERITGTIKESLDGVRIIQSFNLEEVMSNRFHKEADEFLFSRKRIHQNVEMASPVTEFITACLVLGLLTYMGIKVTRGEATAGTLMAYIGVLLQLGPPVKKFQESYVRLHETEVATARAFSLLEDPNEVPQSKSLKPFPKDWKTITYKNVSFAYGSEKILKRVNLTIHRGEMIAFVGSSGSGKSTIVNLLERFFDPSEGEILIDETPINEINLKDLRHNVALVTQDVFLFSDSIERNIWAGDFSKSPEGVIPAAQSANAHAFISRTPNGYQNKVGDRGNLLSGGEKQRVSIARAIFKDAPILILDEATSALDSQSEVEVQKGLDQLMQGRTALVIAHRLSTISRANRIIVMKAGEIIETGTHQSLLEQKGEYHALHELQKL